MLLAQADKPIASPDRIVTAQQSPTETHGNARSARRSPPMGGRAGACMPIWMHGYSVGSFLAKRGLSMTLKQSLAGAVAFVGARLGRRRRRSAARAQGPAAVDQQATGYVEVYSGWAGTRTSQSCMNSANPFRTVSTAGRWAGQVAPITGSPRHERAGRRPGGRYLLEFVGGGGHFSTRSYLVGGH